MKITKEILNEAKKAAQNWMSLIDGEKYSQAYSLTAPYFKENISEKSWLSKIKPVLQSRSPISDRKLFASKHFTSLPDAPDGDYFVMQFSSEGSKKNETIETITPVLDNGQWKVCGYYIK